jgi:hypothetical protein
VVSDIGPYERRIGERVAVDPIAVRWVVVADRAGRFGRRRNETVEHPGRILDVSVTGAAIEGPSALSALVGKEVSLLTEEGESVVRVRRVADTSDPARHVYGVMFVQLHEELQARIDALLGRRRPGEDAWRRAW